MPGPRPAGDLRGRAQRRRGGPRPFDRGGLLFVLPRADRCPRRSHRCTRRRCGPVEGVVVKVQRPGIDEVVREDIATMSWLAPIIEKRNDGAIIANLAAYVELFAETIVEELGLPSRGAEHARRRPRAGAHRAAGAARPPSASRARDAPGPRDGARRRLPHRRDRRARSGGHQHDRRVPRTDGELRRGRAHPRRVPRRPARREHARHRRRHARAARLRHHRTLQRREASRAPRTRGAQHGAGRARPPRVLPRAGRLPRARRSRRGGEGDRPRRGSCDRTRRR